MTNLLQKIQTVDNKWFFKELPAPFKIFLFFVRGDLIVLLPFLIFVFLIGLYSFRFMLLVLGIYISVRYLGEMMYWFSHQFYERTYRPYDFGFKKLDNHAIYIIYQTFAIAGVTIGATIAVGSLYFLK